MSNAANARAAGGPRFHLFDIRNIIGALLAIYGLVLLVAGLVPAILADHHQAPADNRVDLYIGTDANWWVGICLLIVAATFLGWAYLRPVALEDTAEPGRPDE